jgi:hypothetical protein
MPHGAAHLPRSLHALSGVSKVQAYAAAPFTGSIGNTQIGPANGTIVVRSS